MTEPRWEDVRRILEQALDLSAADRAPFLDSACADQPELRREVEALLAAREHGGAWLKDPQSAPGLEKSEHRLGKYRLLREIGRGGMGAIVWLAHDEAFDRDVALKVLAEGMATSAQELERFLRESMSTGKLVHPHVVRVYDEGRADNARWFAMEYVAGHDLGTEIKLQHSDRLPNDPPPILPPFADARYIAASVALVADVADALEHAHGHGILHRDIKPRNLLLDPRGHVYVADFGLARDSRFGSMSQSDAILGTPHYMSPEQARVLNAPRVDHRTDVYSLGVVLYELLTLQRPFEGRTSDEIRARIQREDAKPVRTINRRVPIDLATICHGAMCKTVSARYRSAAALAADLRRFLAHEAILYRPPPFLQRLAQRARRHRAVLSAISLLLVVLSTAFWWSRRESVRLQQQEVLTSLRELDPQTLDRQGTVRLASSLQALRRLQAQRYVASDRDEEHLQALRRAFGELEASMVQQGRALVAAQASAAANPTPETDDEVVLRGVALLNSAAMIFDRPELLREVPANPFAPRLSVSARDPTGAARAGSVAYRVLDPVTGEAGPLLALGPLPLQNGPVPEGFLRIVVAIDGFGIREFARYLHRGVWDYRIDCVAQPEPAAAVAMVQIQGGVLELHDEARPMSGINNRRLEIAPFLLDPCEVSNADYRRFLREHPEVTPPAYWAQVEPGSRRDDLPVVLLGWYQALAYAEWVGKRLPTHAEWAFAARGAEGRRFPWPDAKDGVYLGNTRQPMETGLPRSQEIEVYFARAESVRSHPEAATASGLFHMLGNVAEWTESLAPELHDGTFQPRFHRRIVIGDAWYAANWTTMPGDLTTILTLGPEISYARHTIGFRCARSIP